jgi:hypothetical protein
MSGCKDTNLGRLLLAYEFGALSEEEAERLEMHLVECEHCFDQLDSFAPEAALLSSNNEVKQAIIDTYNEEYSESESFLKRLGRYIWPETPIVFRPALSYLMILLLILPAYWGLKPSPTDKIRSIQVVDFMPGRPMTKRVFRISDGDEGLITFILRGATPGQNYNVAIEFEDGTVIFQDENYSDFDEYEEGRLLLPIGRMKPGDYRLIITDPRAQPPLNKREHSFIIEN